MYLLGEQPAYADSLINQLQSIPTQLLEGLAPAGECLWLEPTTDLSSTLSGNQLFLLESGQVLVSVDQRPLFYLHEGYLIGLRRSSEQPHWQLSCEATLNLVPYLRSALFQHVYADEQRAELFLHYLLGQTVLLTDAVVLIPKEQFLSLTQSNPRIAHSLIENMARRIDLLNKEVIRLQILSSSA